MQKHFDRNIFLFMADQAFCPMWTFFLFIRICGNILRFDNVEWVALEFFHSINKPTQLNATGKKVIYKHFWFSFIKSGFATFADPYQNTIRKLNLIKANVVVSPAEMGSRCKSSTQNEDLARPVIYPRISGEAFLLALVEREPTYFNALYQIIFWGKKIKEAKEKVTWLRG